MYVALTRARNHLNVVHPLSAYGSRGGADYFVAQLSRFFDAGVRKRMQRVTLEATGAGPATEPEQNGLLDLRALLRQRFKG